MSTILLVDDAEIFRDGISHVLRRQGYDVLTACDGIQAIEILIQQSVDLILLDICMPRMDGIGVLQKMRKDPEFLRIPVIMLTASTDRERIIAAAKLGVRDYLSKSPFKISEVLDRVSKYVAPGASVEDLAILKMREGEPAKPKKPAMPTKPKISPDDKDQALRSAMGW